MAEYIERGAAIRTIKTKYRPENSVAQNRLLALAIHDVLTSPAADVAPVQQGAWEGTADGYADGELVFDMWNCSECGFDADGAEEKPDWKFCPNCGARMDGGAGDG